MPPPIFTTAAFLDIPGRPAPNTARGSLEQQAVKHGWAAVGIDAETKPTLIRRFLPGARAAPDRAVPAVRGKRICKHTLRAHWRFANIRVTGSLTWTVCRRDRQSAQRAARAGGVFPTHAERCFVNPLSPNQFNYSIRSLHLLAAHGSHRATVRTRGAAPAPSKTHRAWRAPRPGKNNLTISLCHTENSKWIV